MSLRLIPVVAALLLMPLGAAPKPVRDVEAALARFIDAYANLDWPRFRALFADDVTLFLPGAGLKARRVENAGEADEIWQRSFAELRRQNPGPPYLKLEPKETEVQLWGDTAVATFHLNYHNAVGRRTLVFRKIGRDWKIVHFHGSVIDTTP